jgi:2-polyprenyl-3-methyl-5-hydroxy-6-metoxy-1,4-benzoquinol methylase
MSRQGSDRGSHEVDHGKFLASRGAETIWGWNSAAGRVRARRRADLIIRGGRLGPGKRALEPGCGTGLFTEMFARTGARIVAVDISEDLLAIARQRRFPENRVAFIRKPFEECEIDGPFDAVLGNSVLHHLDVERSLPKLFRLLKPGGWFSFAEPNMFNPQIAAQKNIPWLKRRMGDSPDETAFVRWSLARQMREHGYEQVAIKPFDWLHPSVPAFLTGVVGRLGRILEAMPYIREFAGSLWIVGRRPE